MPDGCTLGIATHFQNDFLQTNYLRIYWTDFHIIFFQAEDGIRDLVRSRGLGDVYKRQRRSTTVDYEDKDFNFWEYRQNEHIQPNVSEFAGPIFIKFSEMIDTRTAMIKLTFVLWLPKNVAMVTN